MWLSKISEINIKSGTSLSRYKNLEHDRKKICESTMLPTKVFWTEEVEKRIHATTLKQKLFE